MRKLLVAFAAFALFGGAAAIAQESALAPGPYLSAFGGANWIQDLDGTIDSDPYEAEYDPGFVVGGALGYRTGPVGPGHVRGEIEAAYRHNEGDDLRIDGTLTDLLGDKSVLSVMANVWYDIPILFDMPFGNPWSVFVGGGVGGAEVALNDISTPILASIIGLLLSDDSDIVFAYQAGAGISVSLPIGADLTAEYRYFATEDPEFISAVDGSTIKSGYESHSAMVGLRVPLGGIAGPAMGGGAQSAAADGKLAEGPYISAFGGANWKQDVDGTFDSDPYDAEYDAGFVAGGALGFRSSPVGPGHVRGEIEAAYRHNEADDLTLDGVASDLLGDKSVLSVMANVWYDIPFGNPWSVFVGGGIGGAKVALNDLAIPIAGPITILVSDDSDNVLAYQAGAGISVSLPIGADLTAEYRYFATKDPEFDTLFDDSTIESEYRSHSFMVGLRVPLS